MIYGYSGRMQAASIRSVFLMKTCLKGTAQTTRSIGAKALKKGGELLQQLLLGCIC